MAEKQSNKQKRAEKNGREDIMAVRRRLTEHNEPVDWFRSGRQEVNTKNADEMDREELIGGIDARR